MTLATAAHFIGDCIDYVHVESARTRIVDMQSAAVAKDEAASWPMTESQ